MTVLRDIGVKVIDAATQVALPGNAPALLHEIAALLTALVAEGRCGAIDLRSVPLTPADRAHLREHLGEGEVHARVNAMGPSEIVETAYRGVWWVTHHDAAGAVCAELIEVTPLPAILAAEGTEIAESLERLRADLDSAKPSP